MAGKVKYDWPSTEGLVRLVRKHGQPEAARRLGIPRGTLTARLRDQGVPPEDRRQQPQEFPGDALAEIRELLDE